VHEIPVRDSFDLTAFVRYEVEYRPSLADRLPPPLPPLPPAAITSRSAVGGAPSDERQRHEINQKVYDLHKANSYQSAIHFAFLLKVTHASDILFLMALFIAYVLS